MRTVRRRAFGTSTPIVLLPGMGAMLQTYLAQDTKSNAHKIPKNKIPQEQANNIIIKTTLL